MSRSRGVFGLGTVADLIAMLAALPRTNLDGEVKFYQVYMNASESPRCLHNWPPHEGKPLSSLFFLDNHQV